MALFANILQAKCILNYGSQRYSLVIQFEGLNRQQTKRYPRHSYRNDMGNFKGASLLNRRNQLIVNYVCCVGKRATSSRYELAHRRTIKVNRATVTARKTIYHDSSRVTGRLEWRSYRTLWHYGTGVKCVSVVYTSNHPVQHNLLTLLPEIQNLIWED